ncbi:MAG: hypothetical protein K8R59_14530 [Thermoanaerobaculales bacterium]|nr:hypothetical protein [Thermoanaerobaculales bacterium]
MANTGKCFASLLIAACCAAPTTAQNAGVSPVSGVPSSGGITILDDENRVTATGTLRYWRAYSTHGGRAMLKVFRPEGSRLVLVGSSPLVTLPPAEIGTFHCSIPVSRNDLVGCYCPDTNCIDQSTTGLILVADGDLGTSQADVFQDQTGGPALFASTTRSFDVPSRAGADVVIPVVGRGPGATGTQWVTSLEVFNTGVQEAQVALYFNLSGMDNTTPAASSHAVIPARSMLLVEDLLLETFDTEDAVGSVDLIASERIIAHANITNIGDAAGTYGQRVPAVPAVWGLGDDEAPGLEPNADIAYLFAAVENDSFRTNAGVCNLSGFALDVDMAAYDGTSPVGETIRLTLPAFSHVQVNHVLNELDAVGDHSGLRLNVTAVPGSEGRFLAYSSRVDNITGDAVFQIADRQPPLAD